MVGVETRDVPDLENVIRSGTGSITYDTNATAETPRCTTSTLQWSRPETNVSTQPTCRHTVTFATMVCYAEVLFQSSFSLCRSTHCLRNMRHPTTLVGTSSEERSTPSTTERDSAQTERVLRRPCCSQPISSQPSVSSQRSENMLRTPSMY